jgi:hypothetical protein
MLGMINMINVPTAGLANRFRSLASSVQLAKDTNSEVAIYWIKNKECFADFTDLFEQVQINGIKIKPMSISKFYLYPDLKKNLYIPGIFRKLLFSKQLINININDDFDVINQMKGNKIYISSHHSFYKHYKLNKLFIPIFEIQSRIDEIANSFTMGTIGLHIRRTDNHQSIAYNSIEDYCHFIKQEIVKKPNVKFYLATDDVIVKNILVESFPNNILYNKATLNRFSLDGMKDAVIDLWCLSKTQKIVGSFYSSYSEIAAELGGIQLEILNR